MERIKLNDEQVDYAVNIIENALKKILIKKGLGTYSSIHEVLGCITEEYNELVNAVHQKDYNNICEELIDLAVGCIFGLACLEAKTIDW